MERTNHTSRPVADPVALPIAAQDTALVAFIRTLREAETAQPARRTATVWDGAQNRYRDVDPADTTDYLCSMAAEMLRLAGQNEIVVRPGAGMKGAAAEALRPSGFWARLKRWLPTFRGPGTKPQHQLAAGYLAMARDAAKRGDHISAQGAARSCIKILRSLCRPEL